MGHCTEVKQTRCGLAARVSVGGVTHPQVAKVYGRFKPDTEERDRWERIATARDAEKSKLRGAKGGANDPRDAHLSHEEGPATPTEREALDNSRGGTRTRDPGIMSAVL